MAIPDIASDFLLDSEELKGVPVRHAGAFLRLKFQDIREVSLRLTVLHSVKNSGYRLRFQVYEMFSNRVEPATYNLPALMNVARESTSLPLHKPLERITRPPL